jgi:hypothetical protein
MAQCAGITRNGRQCTGVVVPPKTYCWWHDPDSAEQRKRAAAKGGTGRLARRVAPLWVKVEEVIAAVEDGRLSPPQGNTMLRGYNTLIELGRLELEAGELEIQRRRLSLDEQERLELLPRLELLEDHAGAAS